MGAKAIKTIVLEAETRSSGRLPVALGLAIGACASLAMWAGVIAAARAIF